jgi:hypothetical protein
MGRSSGRPIGRVTDRYRTLRVSSTPVGPLVTSHSWDGTDSADQPRLLTSSLPFAPTSQSLGRQLDPHRPHQEKYPVLRPGLRIICYSNRVAIACVTPMFNHYSLQVWRK